MSEYVTYSRYKREEKCILHWILDTTKKLIRKHRSEATHYPVVDGTISISKLKLYARIISKHMSPIPTTIFRLLKSVIKARKRITRIPPTVSRQNRRYELEI